MKNNNKKIILCIIGVLLIIIVFLIVLLINQKRKNEIKPEIGQTELEIELKNENIISNLQDRNERERMEYYFGEFLRYIENKEYDKAYTLLYDDFKANYFPTIEDFKQYASKMFSEMMDIKHENIERNGDVYVLWITINDAINGKPSDKKNMNIVIKENDYNDFVISFSVI